MSKDKIQDLAKEMGDWGFTLVRNYATNEWEMLEDETGLLHLRIMVVR